MAATRPAIAVVECPCWWACAVTTAGWSEHIWRSHRRDVPPNFGGECVVVGCLVYKEVAACGGAEERQRRCGDLCGAAGEGTNKPPQESRRSSAERNPSETSGQRWTHRPREAARDAARSRAIRRLAKSLQRRRWGPIAWRRMHC